MKKMGFVGLVGPSNSGKSTFLNAALGKKVSIVSPRPQTTLRAIRGILNGPRGQMVFVDTPGLQKGVRLMSHQLNRLADEQARSCDVLCWMFDVSRPGCFDQIRSLSPLISRWKNRERSLLVLNKIDKIHKTKLLPMLAEIDKLGLFKEMIPVSCRRDDGVAIVLDALWDVIPEGEAMYPAEMLTDRSEDFHVSEIIREKIYQLTKQELPYSVRIDIERLEPTGRNKIPHLLARIHADSDSRKGILIGRKGEMLKEVGIRARRDIETLMGSQVCLRLQVDVEKDWRKDSALVGRYLEIGDA